MHFDHYEPVPQAVADEVGAKLAAEPRPNEDRLKEADHGEGEI